MNSTILFPLGMDSHGNKIPNGLPFIPINLINESNSLRALGLLDTGSTVNILPYRIGQQLGLIWADQKKKLKLVGGFARATAYAVTIEARVDVLPPVQLVFAWTEIEEAPLILGQVNFFDHYDVCFNRARARIEIRVSS